ncbi:AMP-binding protein [Sulfitobacter aestuariivivens]|uniref:AMP-binding protein n=1 Tax=Sulfitobacter aestuariivivens TaxID=2766981 RepID=UPI00361F32D3
MAHRYPLRPFMEVLPRTAEVYGIAAGHITYGDALHDVTAWQNRLSESGYGSGMRIGLLVENRPLHFIILLAANRLGMAIVPINPDLRAAELEYMIGHAEPALIIAIHSRRDDLAEAAANTPVDVAVITPDAPCHRLAPAR